MVPDTYLGITVQSFDAIENHVQRPRNNACTSDLTSSLNCVSFARVGYTVSEQQAIPAFQNISD